VGNLISARSEKELKLLLKVYTADFAAVFRENGEDAIKLARCLKKVGLFYRDGNLVFADPQKTRWRQVSLLERLDTHMPTTSNTIESLNGRLNAKTPRFNCFWGSLHRFRKTIVNKTERFWRSLSHNKEYERGKATRRAKNLPADRMARELAFFHTTQDACLCGETAFARTLYRTDVLCSHRLAVWSREHPNPGWDIPPIDDGPQIYYSPRQVWRPCEAKVNIVVRSGSEPDDPFRQSEVEHLVKLIVRDAHAQKRRDEVRAFVDTNLDMESDEFALGQSASSLDVHRRGVILFRGRRRAQTGTRAA
jgi:hypothetical protein